VPQSPLETSVGTASLASSPIAKDPFVAAETPPPQPPPPPAPLQQQQPPTSGEQHRARSEPREQEAVTDKAQTKTNVAGLSVVRRRTPNALANGQRPEFEDDREPTLHLPTTAQIVQPQTDMGSGLIRLERVDDQDRNRFFLATLLTGHAAGCRGWISLRWLRDACSLDRGDPWKALLIWRPVLRAAEGKKPARFPLSLWRNHLVNEALTVARVRLDPVLDPDSLLAMRLPKGSSLLQRTDGGPNTLWPWNLSHLEQAAPPPPLPPSAARLGRSASSAPSGAAFSSLSSSSSGHHRQHSRPPEANRRALAGPTGPPPPPPRNRKRGRRSFEGSGGEGEDDEDDDSDYAQERDRASDENDSNDDDEGDDGGRARKTAVASSSSKRRPAESAGGTGGGFAASGSGPLRSGRSVRDEEIERFVRSLTWHRDDEPLGERSVDNFDRFCEVRRVDPHDGDVERRWRAAVYAHTQALREGTSLSNAGGRSVHAHATASADSTALARNNALGGRRDWYGSNSSDGKRVGDGTVCIMCMRDRTCDVCVL
ncbi:Hypothetical protein UVM_LOCUS348, partial [uncultured virus]